MNKDLTNNTDYQCMSAKIVALKLCYLNHAYFVIGLSRRHNRSKGLVIAAYYFDYRMHGVTYLRHGNHPTDVCRLLYIVIIIFEKSQ